MYHLLYGKAATYSYTFSSPGQLQFQTLVFFGPVCTGDSILNC